MKIRAAGYLAILLAICISSNVLAQSTILDNQTNFVSSSHLFRLENWLGQGSLTLKNIYTKTSGDTSTDFHAAVDGQGQTFSLMKITDGNNIRIIGGYNPQGWSTINSYNFSSAGGYNAFIFNLTSEQIWRQTATAQTYNRLSYGPTFGGGHDLYVNSALTTGYSYSSSYGTPTHTYNEDLLGNTGDWTILELEVFKFHDSRILNDQTNFVTGVHLDQLQDWLGGGAFTLHNIYTKASGDTSTDFHAAVDGAGPTFSLMKVTDGTITRVIGGYNPQSWSSIGGYNSSSVPGLYTAFIFNLTDTQIWRQTATHQTYNNSSYGPTFGGGHDIYVNSTLSRGYSYSTSYGTATTSYNLDLLGNPNDWAILEIEVFNFFECTYDLAGDANNDCKIDMEDFALMASNWLIDCGIDPSDTACIPK